MIRFLVRIALLCIIGLVCYNYFFGQADEKAQSKRIFQSVGSVLTSVRDMLHTERDKGTFDKAINGLDDALQKLKTHANETNDPNLKQKVADLEHKKDIIQQDANANAQQASPNSNNKGITGNMNNKAQNDQNVMSEIESLTNDIQKLVNNLAPRQ